MVQYILERHVKCCGAVLYKILAFHFFKCNEINMYKLFVFRANEIDRSLN